MFQKSENELFGLSFVCGARPPTRPGKITQIYLWKRFSPKAQMEIDSAHSAYSWPQAWVNVWSNSQPHQLAMHLKPRQLFFFLTHHRKFPKDFPHRTLLTKPNPLKQSQSVPWYQWSPVFWTTRPVPYHWWGAFSFILEASSHRYSHKSLRWAMFLKA